MPSMPSRLRRCPVLVACGFGLTFAHSAGISQQQAADFYRQGDGNIESFTAHMFVSEVDEADDIPGIQNVWIEQVGCGHAIANFN